MKYLPGFAEMILKVSKCFAFRSQVYETYFGRVITPKVSVFISATMGCYNVSRSSFWRYIDVHVLRVSIIRDYVVLSAARAVKL